MFIFVLRIANDHRHGQAEYDEVKVEESAVPRWEESDKEVKISQEELQIRS